MRCVICKTGEMATGTVTVTPQRGETTIVIKDVPALVCAQRGEYCLSDGMTDKVLAIAEDAARKGAKVEILRWAA